MSRTTTRVPYQLALLLVALGMMLSTFALISVQQARAASLPDPVQIGHTTLSNIKLNGVPGTQITVAPGTNVTITANWSDFHDNGYCLNCIDNVPVAFEGFGPQPAGCIENEGFHGQSGVGTVNLGNAPMTPGTYNIIAKFMYTYYCEQNWNGVGATVIAQVIVEEPDVTSPTIDITIPEANAIYTLNQVINAAYSCTDEAGGSGLASCVGSVANGAPIDTNSVGSKIFTVNAVDNAGNTNSASVSYVVTNGICVLYDQTKSRKAGSTVPVKLQVCDAAGVNLSSSDLVVTATGLTKVDSSASTAVEDAGNANPDSNFRYDAELAGYIYNLKTTGLTAGTWQLSFTVAGDAVTHFVRFDVR